MIYKDISQVNWSLLQERNQEIDVLGLEGSFLVPQLLAFVATQLPLAYTAEGKVSFKGTGQQIINHCKEGNVYFASGRQATAAEVKGILLYLTAEPRGTVLGKANKQISPQIIRYATGVPLILSAYREYRDIPYSLWDWSEPVLAAHNYFLDKSTQELIPFILDPSLCSYTNEELLAFQIEGSTVKSTGSQKYGQIKPSAQVTSITGIVDPHFRALPKLLKLMLCQTWVFQPQVRSKYCLSQVADVDKPAPDIAGGVKELFAKDKPVEGDLEW